MSHVVQSKFTFLNELDVFRVDQNGETVVEKARPAKRMEGILRREMGLIQLHEGRIFKPEFLQTNEIDFQRLKEFNDR